MTCCNKNCNQGKNCPARQACELPIDLAEQDTLLDDLIRSAKWPLILLTVLLIVSFAAGYYAG